MMPARKAGHTILMMLNEKPADMIQAESVVPMLAPMMIEMACARVRRAALTKETVMTVVAAEDWTATVTRAPVATPVKRLVVMAPRRWRSCGPAIFWSASLITFIPYIKRAMDPSSFKAINILFPKFAQIYGRGRKNARKKDGLSAVLLFVAQVGYACSMAPIGQTPAQVPQSTQAFGSIL